MTGIVFLDGDFKPVSAPVDNFTSLIWSSRYYQHGSASAVLPIGKYSAIKGAAYIYNPDNSGCAVVDKVHLSVSDDAAALSGKTLESWFDRRTVRVETKMTGSLETAVRTLVTVNAITPPRAVPHLVLGDIAGYTETIDTSIEAGTKLSDALYTALKPFGMSYSIMLDYEAGEIIFTVVKGLNRRQSQNVNPWAIFSTGFENLRNAEYERLSDDYANYAYVAADDSEYGTVVIAVNESTGADRREIYVPVHATSKREDGTTMSLDEYKNLLASIGVEALAENAIIENANGDIDVTGSLKYGTHYGLGDWCDIIVAEHGLSWDAQITTVDEVYEGGSKRVIPSFGEEAISLKKYISKAAKSSANVTGATSVQYENLDALSTYVKLRDKSGAWIRDSGGNRLFTANEIIGAGVYRSAYSAAEIDRFVEKVLGA